MRILKGILNEELERSQRLLVSYAKMLEKLPKGVLIPKKVRGRSFWYRAYREKDKVIFKYLGKLGPEQIEKFKQERAERKNIQKMAKEVKKQIVFIQRALHERRRQNPL
jgi:hypothetical protein